MLFLLIFLALLVGLSLEILEKNFPRLISPPFFTRRIPEVIFALTRLTIAFFSPSSIDSQFGTELFLKRLSGQSSSWHFF